MVRIGGFARLQKIIERFRIGNSGKLATLLCRQRHNAVPAFRRFHNSANGRNPRLFQRSRHHASLSDESCGKTIRTPAVPRPSTASRNPAHHGPAGILNLSAPTTSAAYLAARQKVLGTPLDSSNYETVLQAATKVAVEGGSNITLWTQAQPYVTAKGFSAFPVIDGSFRWNGLTISSS